MKQCTKCRQRKPLSEFNRHRSTRDGRDGACKRCRRKQIDQYYKDNPEKYREMAKANNRNKVKREAGPKRALVEKLLKRQKGKCAICRTPLSLEVHPRNHMYPRLDHDHECCPVGRWCVQCVRGLLCRSCNYGLGCFKDSPGALTRAAAYLRRM